ncbi:MAG: cupredoxin domain-containing protein [Alphaproteobacteria bacterium]
MTHRRGKRRFPALRSTVGLAFGAALLAGVPVSLARADEDVFTLTIKDHRFEPNVLEVPAGKKFKVVVKNLDSTPEEFESYELNREKVIRADSEGVVFLGPLDPGTYDFFGEFHIETATGKLVVK